MNRHQRRAAQARARKRRGYVQRLCGANLDHLRGLVRDVTVIDEDGGTKKVKPS
jgi:hypothetical protein